MRYSKEKKVITYYDKLIRGDQFIGNPQGGWIFVKTDIKGIAVRLADGGTVQWEDNAEVHKVQSAS
jgi:hypothetical protein